MFLSLKTYGIGINNRVNEAPVQSCSLSGVHQSNLSSTENLNRVDGNMHPIGDQGSLGYCFSFAANELIESWYKEKDIIPENERLSAIGAGIKSDTEYLTSRAPYYLTDRVLVGAELGHEDIDAKIASAQSHLDSLKGQVNATSADDDLDVAISFYEQAIELLQKNRSVSEYSSYSANGSGLSDNELSPTIGGNVRNTILEVAGSVCLDRNMNISDQAVQDVVDQYQMYDASIQRDKHGSEHYLKVLALSQYDAGLRCKSYLMTRELLPNLSFGSFENFDDYVTNLNPYDSIISDMINNSCINQEGIPTPEIEEVEIPYENRTYPIINSKSEEIFKLIDEGLDHGRPVAISYNQAIFEKDFEVGGSIQAKQHASVVTGKTKICGEDFYIVRNSYGPNSCVRDLSKFSYPSNATGTQRQAKELYSQCVMNVDMSYSDIRNGCQGDINCTEETFSRMKSECIESANEFRIAHADPPYICDENGNYIVKKEHLKKAVYRGNYISN